MLTTVDFETFGIESRPKYPPKPVGVAIWEEGELPEYVAWGHPDNNGIWVPREFNARTGRVKRKGKNDTGLKRVNLSASPEAYARKRLKDIWKGEVLFHNGKFDEDVADAHLDLPLLPWNKYHDTFFTLFLRHPHAPDLKLKTSAHRILKMAPDEQDEVAAWLVKNQPVPGTKITPGKAGKYIAYTPGDLVGLYAIGDVVRTRKLHDHEYPELDEGEREAYDRERRLLPILLRNEREGMRVDLIRLESDIKKYLAERERVEVWIRKRLKSPDLNLDAPAQLAEALDRCGVVTEWMTPDGEVAGEGDTKSTNKKFLTADKFNDPRVFRALGYHSRLGTALSTFMEPWAEVARENDGYIYTNWNQVRGEGGGARSGRIQSHPNFQNIPKVWDDKGDGYEHPSHLKNLIELPLIRKYVLPDKGHLFGHRDYNQQELRILAHYEDDKLLEAYNENPELDVHSFITEQIKLIASLELARREVKVVNFRTVYGGGDGGLAAALDIPLAKAKAITKALRDAIPGLRRLEEALHELAKNGQPLRTFGGRLYYCEPPSYSKKFKRVMSYEYKMLNYLIQPSAADCTKESIIRYHDIRKEGRWLLAVHDENNISVPKKAMKAELLRLREAMASLGTHAPNRWGGKVFDLPMLSEPKVGPTWGDLTKFKEAA